MTRYCASGARSHFSPSSIPHTKCFKNLQRLERKKRAYGIAHQNSFLILDMLSHMPFCIEFVWY